MSVVNKPNTFSANTTISPSEVNANFDTLYNDYNGSIAAANIASSAITTAKIADSNVTTAKIADANVTVAKMSATMGAGTGGTGAWDTWTPTWTNVSGGTLNYAKYIQFGKTVHFRIKYTLAGAGVSAGIIFSTPTTINADYADGNDSIFGGGYFVDTAVARYPAVLVKVSSTTIEARVTKADATYTTVVATTSTAPFTWGNTDSITLSGTYEAA